MSCQHLRISLRPGPCGSAAGGAAAGRAGVTVRISFRYQVNPLPAQEKSLGLFGTAGALARLRAAGPTPVPGPLTTLATQPLAAPAGLVALADKALKAAGYQNGVASLQNLFTQYLKK